VSRDIEIRAAKEWSGGASPYPSAPSGIFDEFGSSQIITMSHVKTTANPVVFTWPRGDEFCESLYVALLHNRAVVHGVHSMPPSRFATTVPAPFDQARRRGFLICDGIGIKKRRTLSWMRRCRGILGLCGRPWVELTLGVVVAVVSACKE